jgi:hypothetical protein
LDLGEMRSPEDQLRLPCPFRSKTSLIGQRCLFGRVRIDPAGLQTHAMVFVQWRRGRKLVVWPPAFSEARPLNPRRRSG